MTYYRDSDWRNKLTLGATDTVTNPQPVIGQPVNWNQLQEGATRTRDLWRSGTLEQMLPGYRPMRYTPITGSMVPEENVPWAKALPRLEAIAASPGVTWPMLGLSLAMGLPMKGKVPQLPKGKGITLPKIKPSLKLIGKVTKEQLLEGHRIARTQEKGIKEYRALAESVTGKSSMADMTAQEADDFINAMGKTPITLPITEVGKMASTKRTDAIASELAEYLGKPKQLPPIISREAMKATLPQRIKETVTNFVARSDRIERVLDKADKFIGGKYGSAQGKMTQTFWVPVQNATDKTITRIYEYTNGFVNQLMRHGLTWKDLDKVTEFQPGLRLTAAERIGVYLNRLHPDNLRHLKSGNGFTDETIKAVSNSLTAQERAIADWLFKYWQNGTQSIADTYKIATGKPMRITTPYIPIVIKNMPEFKVFVDYLENTVLSKYTKRWPSTGISKGFTKPRTATANQPIELDAIRVFLRQVQAREHFVNFSPVIKDLQRIYNNPKFAASFSSKAGEPYYRVLGQWLKDVAETNPLVATTYSDRMLQTIRGNALAAIAGINITMSLKQFPSFLMGATEIGNLPALKGLFSYLSNPKGTTALLKRYSPQIWQRDLEREFAEARVAKEFMGKIRPREILTWLMTTMDKLAVRGIWQGAFDDAMKRGLSEQQAADYASRSIRRTQSFFSIKDVAEYWRSGEFMKALTMFTNELNNYWNYFRYDVVGRTQAGELSPVQALQRVAEGYVLSALVIGWMSRGKPATDAKTIASDIASQGLSMIPIVGGVMSGVLVGNRTSQGLVTTEILDELSQFAYDVNKGAWDKVALDIPELVGFAAGLPTIQPKRTIQGIIDLASGKSNDWLRLIYSEYQRKQAGVSDTVTPRDFESWAKPTPETETKEKTKSKKSFEEWAR